MKFRLIFQILFFVIFAPIANAAGPVTAVPMPVNNCDTTNPPAVPTNVNWVNCNAAYNTELDKWKVSQKVIELSASTSNPVTTDPATGKLKPPINMCAAGDTICHQAHAVVVTNVNSMNNTMSGNATTAGNQADLQAKQSEQPQAAVEIETLTDNSAAGSLMQVMQNNNKASFYYGNSSGIFQQFSTFTDAEGTAANMGCSATNYSSCDKAAAGFAASAYYTNEKNKADEMLVEIGALNTVACNSKNEISIEKNVCNVADPSSPIYNRALVTPPDSTWFDPITGLCRPNAPQLCSEILITVYGSFSNPAIPRSTNACPGGGSKCLEGYTSAKTVTTTPQGTKVTFTTKNGKVYTYSASDFKSEKSLIKAGLSPATAKQLMKELEMNSKLIDQKATAAANVLQQKLAEAQNLEEEKKKKAAVNEANAKAKKSIVTTTPSDLPVQVSEPDRAPSSEGLTIELNGDLIGVRGDDIFKMINRRYQHKNQQILFFGQYQ